MVKLNFDKILYVKTSELKEGDGFKLLDAGEWVESKYSYEDGTPKKDLLFKVMHDGKEKRLKCNKYSQEELSNAWGTDTDAWKGKEVLVNLEFNRSLKTNIAILKPVAWEE